MKRDAHHTDTMTSIIITTNIGGMHEELLAKLPHIDTIQQEIRRQWAVNRPYPEIPENTLFEIPHPYNVSNTSEQFVHYDNRRDDKLIIFGMRESFQFLENIENWFMDRTLSTAPPQFAQQYMVHGLSNRKNIVGTYCLLANKRMETYVELLSRIQLLTNQVVPESIITDFEQSMTGAIAQAYPLTVQKGCLFHLSKSIYHRVQKLGLSHQYLNDAVFHTNVKVISALSFMPIADKIQAFDALNNHAGVEKQAVLDYFERNYIGELQCGRRLEPRYPHTLWNVNLRVHENLPRTNNNLEGWIIDFHGAIA